MAEQEATGFYDTRKIYHGTQLVNYADPAGGNSTGHSTGITKFAPSVEQKSSTIYADAQTHLTLIDPKTLTISTENYQFTDKEMEQMGHEKVNGGFIDTTTHPAFSIQRILTEQDENGKQSKVLEAYYGCTSSDYKESDDEDGEKINPKKYSRTITVNGVNFNINGTDTNVKQFRVERTDENASVFDTYANKVLTPADFASVAGPKG